MSDLIRTLPQLVRDRAQSDGDRMAYVFLPNESGAQSLTWGQLHQRASAKGARLLERGAEGKSVLLLLPSGLEFVEALFACWYAGAIAVPACLPRHRRVKDRLDLLLADASAKLAFGNDDIRARLNEDAKDSAARDLTWIDLAGESSGSNLEPRAEGQNLAVLQYTSGSTGTPRGVMITHHNLICNSAQIAQACGHDSETAIGGWLPLFHDMGLVGLLQAAFTGARCVLMSPERFLMRPWLWLQMISDYRVRSSPAPNFAYDLCVERIEDQHKKDLDLSCWRNALSGAEPVRAATLDRFAAAFESCGFDRSAFFPCYGLAEATLFVTGPGSERQISRRNSDGLPADGAATQVHVGCGRTFGDARVAIVDPQTRRRLPERTIGEIWVAGASCAKGYWNRPDETAATFGAHLDSPQEAGICWLRTGDLGMIVERELFITGRLRELIIIAGRNLFPLDVERAAEASDPALAPFGAAAFSVDADGIERLIIVAEVRREYARAGRGLAQQFEPAATVRRVRAAVAAAHDVTPFDVRLLASGALPRTSSGKIMRRAAREGYLEKTLELLEATDAHAAV